MKIEFDPAKNARNIAERDLSFERAEEFDFSCAKIWQDMRKPYPEIRLLAFGYLDNRLHCLCFMQIENGIRVISFRKANKKEGEQHEFTLTRN
jgi:hypothetical protein